MDSKRIIIQPSKLDFLGKLKKDVEGGTDMMKKQDDSIGVPATVGGARMQSMASGGDTGISKQADETVERLLNEKPSTLTPNRLNTQEILQLMNDQEGKRELKRAIKEDPELDDFLEDYMLEKKFNELNASGFLRSHEKVQGEDIFRKIFKGRYDKIRSMEEDMLREQEASKSFIKKYIERKMGNQEMDYVAKTNPRPRESYVPILKKWDSVEDMTCPNTSSGNKLYTTPEETGTRPKTRAFQGNPAINIENDWDKSKFPRHSSNIKKRELTEEEDNLDYIDEEDKEYVPYQDEIRGSRQITTTPSNPRNNRDEALQDLQMQIESLRIQTELGLSKVRNERAKSALAAIFVKPPTQYGNCTLSINDCTSWRYFKKDYKEHLTVESALKFLNNFLAGQSFKYTQESIKANLSSLLPPHCLADLDGLLDQEATLDEIYAELQTLHGTKKTDAELRQELELLIENKDRKEPLEVLNKMNSLLLRTTDNRKSCEKECIAQARKFIKNLGGQSLVSQIECLYRLEEDTSFRTYMRVIKHNFAEVLLSYHKRTYNRINHVSRDFQSDVADLQNLPSSQNWGDVIINQVRPLCYSCGSPNHFRRQCTHNGGNNISFNNQEKAQTNYKPYAPRQMISMSNRKPYNSLQCHLHNFTHLNQTCRTQQNQPCQRPNHQFHKMAVCRSMVLVDNQGRIVNNQQTHDSDAHVISGNYQRPSGQKEFENLQQFQFNGQGKQQNMYHNTDKNVQEANLQPSQQRNSSKNSKINNIMGLGPDQVQTFQDYSEARNQRNHADELGDQ